MGYKKRIKNTRKFTKNIKLTYPIKNKDKLYNELKNFDILLSGSDQIWNPRYYSTSEGLYLFENISEITKASYASSFGVISLDSKYQELIKQTLSNYDYLSCRENSGVKILNEIGLNSLRNIDPTFLLTIPQWKRFFTEEPIVRGKYICCYVMPGADKLNRFVIKVAEKILQETPGIERIVILGEKEYKGLFSRHIYYRTAGPSEFLNIIYNAERILTSSFHGT